MDSPAAKFKNLYLGHETLLNLTAQILGHLLYKASIPARTPSYQDDKGVWIYPESVPSPISPEARTALVTEARALAQACIGAVEPNDQLQADLEGCQRELDGTRNLLERTAEQRDRNAAGRDAALKDWSVAADARADLTRQLEAANAETVRVSQAERQIADERVAVVRLQLGGEINRLRTELVATQRLRENLAKPTTCTHGVPFNVGCAPCGAGGRRTVDDRGLQVATPLESARGDAQRAAAQGSGPFHAQQDHGGVGPCLNCVPAYVPEPVPFTPEMLDRVKEEIRATAKRCVHERPLSEPCGACGRGARAAADFSGPQRPVPSHGAAEPEKPTGRRRPFDLFHAKKALERARSPDENETPTYSQLANWFDDALTEIERCQVTLLQNGPPSTGGPWTYISGDDLHQAMRKVLDELDLYPPQPRTIAIGDPPVTWQVFGFHLAQALELNK